MSCDCKSITLLLVCVHYSTACVWLAACATVDVYCKCTIN